MLKNIKRFMHDDDKGSVTIIFGLSLVALVLSVGLAIDYSRAVAFYDRTQIALDATALAVSKAAANGATDAEQKLLAQRYFDVAMKGKKSFDAALGDLKVKANAQTKETEVSIDSEVHTAIGRLIGIKNMKRNLVSAALSSGLDIELGMMLDVSGSMQGDKLTALKSAAKGMIDQLTMHNSNERKARVALIPYSTSINLGGFAFKARGPSNKDHTCVSERKGGHAFKDTPPSAGNNLFGDKPSECPTSTVQPLTDDKALLYSAIDQMNADGSTAGHLGIAWAWYSVSHSWEAFWGEDNAPAADDSAKLVKAVVLLTDGMFNKEYESSNGKSAKQAEKLCANMKKEGVVVFTIAFDAPDEVLPLFEQCATNPTYAFDVKSSAALKKSFSRIAQFLNDLRIAR